MIQKVELPPFNDIHNPFNVSEEDLEWLELGNIPAKVYNPLLDYPIGQMPSDPVDEMVGLLMNPDYLHFAARVLLNVELPPYQLVILDTLWRRRLPMLIGNRGAAKSYCLAVYCLLRMIFHPGCKIVICGAGLRQSRQVFDYMISIWDKAPVLKDIAGKGKTAGPRREVDRYQFEIGDSYCYAIPIGDGTKIRGLRANYIIADEFASIPPEIFNLVVQGFAIVSASPIEKIKEAAVIKKLKRMGVWTDELQRVKDMKSSGNQIVYSGTASYAFNHFYKYFKKWHGIISSKGNVHKIKEIFGEDKLSSEGFNWRDYAVLRIPYTAMPEGMLDAVMLAQAKATLSNSQFGMEYGATFAIDSDGFFRRSLLEAATVNKPILVPSGELVQFSASRQGNKDRFCVMGVDPAADQDNAAITIVEMYLDHRRIVHCWTTNKKKYNDLKRYMKKTGVELEDDYYRYIAQKIKELMSQFNIEHIIMDKNGGGTAIAEALGSKKNCAAGEYPIYQIINPDEPKPDDMEKGIHILELLAPTSDINIEANHGMKKDLEEKILLFPLFDTIELEKAIQIDQLNNLEFDTYEDLVQDIEELKNEMTSIVVTPSSVLGRETFDTPSVKSEGDKKGHLRKDRYSALLYANYYARNKGKDDVLKMEYKAVGGTKHTLKKNAPGLNTSTNMYRGPGLLKFGQSKWNIVGGANYTNKRKF